MHNGGALTTQNSDGANTSTNSASTDNESEEKTSHQQRCDTRNQLQVYHDPNTFDFLTNLPLKVLEYIVENLSVIDTLIMCHTSPLLNEHITMLHDSWKRKWMKLCTCRNDKTFQPNVNWKAICEETLALMLKFSQQTAVLNLSENLYLRIRVTSMDYLDGMLLCFGEACGQYSDRKVFAHLYTCSKQPWKSLPVLLTTFPIPGHCTSITACSLIAGYKIIAGRSDGALFIWNLDITTRLVSLVSFVRFHTRAINNICADPTIGIGVSTGYDDRLQFWHLKTHAQLASFVCSGIIDVKILSGDDSPFVGYNCVLITAREESLRCSVAMICWGKDIPLKEAVFARNVCHTEKYDYGWSQSVIIPKVFVQGGSLVYGLELLDDFQRRIFQLVWQPLDLKDFTNVESAVSDEEFDKFCASLHPCIKNCVVPLPEKTGCILGVGKCFSVSVTKYNHSYSTDVTLIVNETGDTERLRYSGTKYLDSGLGIPAKLVSTKWLDGLNHVQPGSVCLISIRNDEGFMMWTWRKDFLNLDKPLLSELLAVQKQKKGILASLV